MIKSSVNDCIAHQIKIKIIWPMQAYVAHDVDEQSRSLLWASNARINRSVRRPIEHQLKLDMSELLSCNHK